MRLFFVVKSTLVLGLFLVVAWQVWYVDRPRPLAVRVGLRFVLLILAGVLALTIAEVAHH